MSHSILPPSSAHIWGSSNGCTGWVKMMESIPPEERDIKTEKSIEGDQAHDLGAAMIDSSARGALDYPPKSGYDSEMYQACELYANDVRGVMRDTRIFGAPYLGIEKKLDIWAIYKNSFGTPDAFIYDYTSDNLYVWDFKYGHAYVEEFENWQCMCYAAGIISLLVTEGLDDKNLKIHIRIVQPRAYGGGGPIREWCLSAIELKHYVKILADNAQKALSSEALNRTGPHCRYCEARKFCPDALNTGVVLYENVSTPSPQNMSLKSMGVQYSILKRAKEQIDALESGYKEQIIYLLKSGKSIPGYNLTPALGRMRWNRPEEEIISMGDMMGVDLRNIKALTPNQAREKNINEELIKSFSERPNNGYKLEKDDTKMANRIFLTEEK